MAAETQRTVQLVALAAIAGVVLYVFNKAGKIGAGALDAVSSGIADFWNSLTLPAPINVLGSVVLPSGSVVAISSLQWRQDNQGNAYTNVGGTVYQMAPRDANGNFTLIPYSPPSG